LRFLETRFGAEVPNLSAWRRAAVGDLTSALNFKKPDQSIPTLPSTIAPIPQAIAQCAANLAGFTPYTVPSTQAIPPQEFGTAARPSGVCSLGAMLRRFSGNPPAMASPTAAIPIALSARAVSVGRILQV
jgi:phospholipase C